MARKKTIDNKSQVQVNNFVDIKNALVATLNGLAEGTIDSSRAKTQAYILQTLLSTVKQIHENEDLGQDSIKELCELVKAQRDQRESEKTKE